VPDEEIYYLLMSGRKKSFIKNGIFFALLSRNLVGRTKMSKKSLWKKPTLKKTNKIHLLLLTHLLHLST